MSRLRTPLAALAITVIAASPAPAQGADTVGVRLAGLTWFLDSLLPKHAKNLTAVCIGFSRAAMIGTRPMNGAVVDLSADEIALLPKASLPVRPASACSTRPLSRMPTIETATGLPATAVEIGPPRSTNADRTTFGLEMRVNALYGSGYLCEAVRSGSIWRVTSCRMTWIS